MRELHDNVDNDNPFFDNAFGFFDGDSNNVHLSYWSNSSCNNYDNDDDGDNDNDDDDDDNDNDNDDDTFDDVSNAFTCFFLKCCAYPIRNI